MDQPKWLKLAGIGLLLVLLGVAYFLIIGRFSAVKQESAISVPTPIPVASIAPLVSPSPSSKSAYDTVMDRRSLVGTKELPSTGFPAALVGIFSGAAVLAGFGLKKFPH